jgi:1-acyl-sn-glycerol-3-phosphate acyltransferase
VRIATVLYGLSVFRARGIGSERVPGGPLILAPNHASFMHHFFAGAFVRRRIQFMAKSQLFSGAILGSYQICNWKRLQFPRVSVSYGEPLRFGVIEHPTREQLQEAADRILDRIRTLHAELQRAGSAHKLRTARARTWAAT